METRVFTWKEGYSHNHNTRGLVYEHEIHTCDILSFLLDPNARVRAGQRFSEKSLLVCGAPIEAPFTQQRSPMEKLGQVLTIGGLRAYFNLEEPYFVRSKAHHPPGKRY